MTRDEIQKVRDLLRNPNDVERSLERYCKAIEILDAALAQPDAQPVAHYGVIDPDYARVFTIARCLAWQEGYALAMHGSFTRDLDLIAVPWTDSACDPEHLVRRIVLAAELEIHSTPGEKPHGRLAFTLMFKGFGDPRFIDLSVAPRQSTSHLSPAQPVAWTVDGLITDFSRDFSAYRTKTYTKPLFTHPPEDAIDVALVTVPRAPTAAMLVAGMFHTKNEELDEDDPRLYRAKGCAAAVWHDMIAAAMKEQP